MEYHGRRHLIRSVSTILALAVGGTASIAQAQDDTPMVGGIEEVIEKAKTL